MYNIQTVSHVWPHDKLHDTTSAGESSRVAGAVEAVLGFPLHSPGPLGLDGVKHGIVEELRGAVVVRLTH